MTSIPVSVRNVSRAVRDAVSRRSARVAMTYFGWGAVACSIRMMFMAVRPVVSSSSTRMIVFSVSFKGPWSVGVR